MSASTFDLGEDPALTGRQRELGWLLLGCLAYFLAGLLGRETIAHGETLSLVWPAAGVSMLMFGLSSVRSWPLAAVLVALATYVTNTLTGAGAAVAVVFIASNVVQAPGAVLLLRRFSPQLRGAGGREGLTRLRDFWSVLAAALVGSMVGATVGTAGLALVDSASWSTLFVWWGRNVAGSVVVMTTGILLFDAVAGHPGAGRLTWRTPVAAQVREVASHRWAELLGLVVLTLALYVGVFFRYADLPVAFPLLVPTVWVGMRFAPLSVALHSLFVSVLVVVFTLVDRGPFARLSEWRQEVLISQLFIGLVFCLGMLLALSRTERVVLTRVLRRARTESEGQAQMMSAIIDSMQDGLTLVDDAGRVLMRNPAGRALTHAEDGSGTDLTQYVMTDVDGAELAHQDLPQVRVFTTDDYVNQDMRLSFRDGSPSRTISVSGRRLRTEGEQDRAVLIYHDVTSERAQRSALESFASVVAHDLLGPLAVVDGWADLLASELGEDGRLDADSATPKLERIQVAAKGMRQLINDLLESSTSRDQELRRTRVDLTRLTRSLAQQRSAVPGQVASRITVERLPPAYADEVLVRQLLDNLLGNAIKYVVHGEIADITVSGRLVGDMVEVCVADRGIGIPADERERIFEAFHRAHPTKEYAGHGIGLAVCRKIVERHGGRISARAPQDGPGTRIVLTLPHGEGVGR